MKLVRKFLFFLLGTELYLRLVSKIYIVLISKGLLKKNYPELFYLNKIIKPGSTCIDIGANLGYYSTVLSKLTGIKGKVYSVEPVPLFASIWKKNVLYSGINNLELLQCALGASTSKVKMATPEVNGVFHHGMTKILNEERKEKYVKYYEVDMKVPDDLFSGLQQLDFVKCDVEGYEFHVFSNMQNVISKFKPLIQSELSGEENRTNVIGLLTALGYKTCFLNPVSFVMEEASLEQQKNLAADFYFIPNS